MILKNRITNYRFQIPDYKGLKFFNLKSVICNLKFLAVCYLLLVASGCSTCKYTTKDIGTIPPDVKTFRVNYLENKARYINTQLSPQLTEKLKQKIISSTRLRQTNDDSAHYDISGYVSDYSVTTTGITGANASTNRLTVSFHLIFKNRLDDSKSFESDVTSTFDFDARLSLQDAERSLNDNIVSNTVDAIFNKIFSNW